MGKVILDAETRAKLHGLAEVLELYDESNNLIGYCVPPKLFTPKGLPADPPFTDAEVEAAFNQSGPGRPLADILAGLRKR